MKYYRFNREGAKYWAVLAVENNRIVKYRNSDTNFKTSAPVISFSMYMQSDGDDTKEITQEEAFELFL